MVEKAARRAPAIKNAVWLRPLPPAARFSFYGDAAARVAAVANWGVEFSEQPLRANTQGTRSTLWLGPDEYLLIDLGAEPGSSLSGATASALELALASTPHSLVDISHRQFALEISGPHAATILNGACPLDLDLAQFPIGMCTRTVLAKADIVLWRTGADTFHLEVWRSFAGYVTGILEEIAAEFHPPPGV